MNTAAARKRLAEVGGAAPHEARHAAAAILLDVPVVEASALPQVTDGDLDLGYVALGPERWEYEEVRKRALVTLVGNLGERDDWPPPHPSHPSMKGKVPARQGNDGARLWKAIRALGMDETDYDALVQEARDLVKRRDFRRLEVGISRLLEQGHVVGPDLLDRVHEITQRESKTVPASANALEDGRFAALGDARYATARDRDRIAEGAFKQTIQRWQDSDEQIPIYWSELPSFRHRVGAVDTLRDEGSLGLFVEASIDLEGEQSSEADDAWTAVKSNEVALRLDYDVLANDEAEGVRTLQELDLSSLTLIPTAEGRDAVRRKRIESERELRRKSDELRVEVALGCTLDEFRGREASEREPEPTPTEYDLYVQAKELGLDLPSRKAGVRHQMLALFNQADWEKAA